MLNGKRIFVVLPAYNAERTLKQTYQEIPLDIVDSVLLVDDGSVDRTVSLAKRLGIETILHDRNYGYGRNQKTCYKDALRRNADIVIMVHPDYQYTPKLITAMASMIAFEVYDVVLGSRIIGGRALKGGMPKYKYIANRFLTACENIILGSKLSEFHTGYRAFSREVLENLPLGNNSDDFVFDNEMLVQIIYFGYRIGEISCPTRYSTEASSIGLRKATKYGVGVLITTLKYLLHKLKLREDPLFDTEGHRLTSNSGVDI
ncbi:MAG: glycosyltransferase family 2 protein [Deltaproteobacteria bacterium]|nr:glycosyltransferase family 2 protein [Deltaproteobacteria bacterium]